MPDLKQERFSMFTMCRLTQLHHGRVRPAGRPHQQAQQRVALPGKDINLGISALSIYFPVHLEQRSYMR